MPVTAKLSRKFYETFGDDITNELVDWFNVVDTTYKSDLRELNERNFQRFDAKLEQRIAELRAELRVEFRQGLAELRAEFRQRLAELRADLRVELGETKSSLLRWMFGFWVGTLVPLAGLVVYLTR